MSFIGYAQDSAHVVPIGNWVLATGCRETAGLGAGAHTSVNVSARQLQHPTLSSSVKAALSSSGLAPERLILEITETASLTDLHGVVATLHELRELGVQVALDDFGTGSSPLSYLQQLPVDYLKIDHSFVRGITTTHKDVAIVRGVVEMAHALGMRAVAEGVEDQAQAELLRQMGCDLAQGYLWQRPAPFDQLRSSIVDPCRRAGRRGVVAERRREPPQAAEQAGYRVDGSQHHQPGQAAVPGQR